MAGPTPTVRHLMARQSQTDSSSSTSQGSWLDGLWYLLVIVGVGVIVIAGAVYGGYRLWLSCYKVRHKKSLSSDSSRDLLISELRNSTSKDKGTTALSEASHSTPPTSATPHNGSGIVVGANTSPFIQISPPSDVTRDQSRPSTPPPSSVASGSSSPALSQASGSSPRSTLSSPVVRGANIDPVGISPVVHPLLEPFYPPRPFQVSGPDRITIFQPPSPQLHSSSVLPSFQGGSASSVSPTTRINDFGAHHPVDIDPKSRNPSNWYPSGVLVGRPDDHTIGNRDGSDTEGMMAVLGIRSPENVNIQTDLRQQILHRRQEQPRVERNADSIQLPERKKQIPSSSHNRHGLSLTHNLEPEHHSLYSALSRNPSTSSSALTVLPPPPPPPYTVQDLPTEPRKAGTSYGPPLAAEKPSPRTSTSDISPRPGGTRGPRSSPLNDGMGPLQPSELHEREIVREGRVSSSYFPSYSLSSEDIPLTSAGTYITRSYSDFPVLNAEMHAAESGVRSPPSEAKITTSAPLARRSFEID